MRDHVLYWVGAAILLLFLACGSGDGGASTQEKTTEAVTEPAEVTLPESTEKAEPGAPAEPTPLTQQQLEELALNQSTQTPAPESQPPASNQQAQTPSTTAPMPPEPQPQSPAPSQSFLRGKEFLLQVRPQSSYPPPHDFQIGQLEGDQPVRVDDPKVIKLFTAFLTRLSRGELAQALIAPAWRDAVSRPLREVIFSGWPPAVEWRLGKLFWENDRLVRAPFILRSGKRWTAGLLYAEPIGNDYLLNDVVVDLMDLRRDREVVKFEPDSYPMLNPLP